MESSIPVRRKRGRPWALTAEQVARARTLRADGASWAELAREFGVFRTTIKDAVQGRRGLQHTAQDAPSAPPTASGPSEAENGGGAT